MDVWNREQELLPKRPQQQINKVTHINKCLCNKKWIMFRKQPGISSASHTEAAQISSLRQQQQVRHWDSNIPTGLGLNISFLSVSMQNEMKRLWHPNAASPTSRESEQCVRVRSSQTGVSWRRCWPIFGVSPSHSPFSPSPSSITPALSIN